ncbi:type II secretion system protein GspK [Pantoea sp. 1.19]|uniref:type II secretion system protein GspK n=1 Tax=Pantoea sp. 1.19 TaxID=1925589 RepID=UPI00111515E9|nr:type II secretion system protein GspK [Pantoea sp. 1.19]
MNRQQGMALLTVLLMVAMMTALVVASQRTWQSALQRTSAQQFSLQAGWTLYGAEQWLRAAPAPPNAGFDSLQLDTQRVNLRWRDAQACFNLNALARPGRRDDEGQLQPTLAQQLFQRLLENAGQPPAQAAAITQQLHRMLNPDETPRPPAMMDEQRRLMSRLPPDQRRHLAPSLCLLPTPQLSISVNGLQPHQAPLLVALLDNRFSEEQARQHIAARPASGWQHLADLFADQTGKAAQENETFVSLARFTSEYWQLTLWLDEAPYQAVQRSLWQWTAGALMLIHREYGVSEE